MSKSHSRDRPAAASMPQVAAEVLAVLDDCGALEWDRLVDGEMCAIKNYMRQNGLPWRFLRVAFDAGTSAYLGLHGVLPELLPDPFRPMQNDSSIGHKTHK